MIIDTHQHVLWHRRNDDGLVADLDENGIDRAWLLTWLNPPPEDTASYVTALNPEHLRPDGVHPGLPLGDVLAACGPHPERFVPGYCPDPRLDNAATWLLMRTQSLHTLQAGCVSSASVNHTKCP